MNDKIKHTIMKKAILLLFLSVLFSSINIHAQKITNVNAHVSGDKIIIDYSINGAKFNESFHVYLLVSFDNGMSYDPVYKVQGDVGDEIRNGKHQIIWDALKEMPFTDEELKFDVRANIIVKEIKRAFFVSYTANDMTPFGLRIGTIGKIGWYVEGRANFSPMIILNILLTKVMKSLSITTNKDITHSQKITIIPLSRFVPE